jgi:hypothetical protein
MKKSELDKLIARLTELKGKADHEHLSAKELGELVDMHKTASVDRLKLDKESEAHKAVETASEQLVIAQLRAQEISAAGGSKIRVALNPVKYAPQIADWTKFYNYIKTTGDFSLLERRPGKAAIAERWEDGVMVPGVEKFPVYTLSKSVVK